jgi:deoxyribonuclease V
MDRVRPALVPDPLLDRAAMLDRQHAVADAASFRDEHAIDVAAIDATAPATADAPVVVGVDQAFDDDTAISTAVAMRGSEVIERAHATRPVETPYVPGLLSYREGPAVCGALDRLDVTPAVVLFDGSGRLHFREAGLATHIGVVYEVPAVGVAKNLLCGRPETSLEDPLPVGERVAVVADEEVTAADGTTIGYAYQSRQFEGGDRHINPLYVSSGHRVSATTAVDIVAGCCGGYKLPAPIRRADAYAEECKT